MIKRVTYDQFRAWLESFRPGQIVGRPSSSCGCPLSTYTGYRATYSAGPQKFAYLTPMNFHGIIVTKLPRWAYRFMCAVDDCEWKGLKKITASRALKLLEECK